MLDAIDAHIRTMLELPNLDANGFAFNLPNVVKKAEVSQTMVDLIVKHYVAQQFEVTYDPKKKMMRLSYNSLFNEATKSTTAPSQTTTGSTIPSTVRAPPIPKRLPTTKSGTFISPILSPLF